jgi:hypothetical protein
MQDSWWAESQQKVTEGVFEVTRDIVKSWCHDSQQHNEWPCLLWSAQRSHMQRNGCPTWNPILMRIYYLRGWVAQARSVIRGHVRERLLGQRGKENIALIFFIFPPLCRSYFLAHNIAYRMVLYFRNIAWRRVNSEDGGAVRWGTALQTGRSRVRFPMVPVDFFHWHNLVGRTMALGSSL